MLSQVEKSQTVKWMKKLCLLKNLCKNKQKSLKCRRVSFYKNLESIFQCEQLKNDLMSTKDSNYMIK